MKADITGEIVGRKCYIAGQMTGKPDFNVSAFMDMERTLIGIGASDIWNPADLIAWHDAGVPDHTIMARDLEALVKCDVVIFLEGWEDSKGACLEYEVAWATGKIIIFEGFLRDSLQEQPSV